MKQNILRKVKRQNVENIEKNTHYINCAIFINQGKGVQSIKNCIFEHCSFRDESLMVLKMTNCQFDCCNFHVLTSNFYDVTFHKCHFIEINSVHLDKVRFDHCYIRSIILHHGKIDLNILSSTKGLINLELQNMIDISNMPYLSSLNNLQSLSINGQTKEDILKHIFSVENIHYLNLANTHLRGAQLQHLQAFSKLQVLNLNQTNLGNSALQYISHIENLREIYLLGTNVRNVESLIPLKKLTTLDLSRTPFGDEGMKELYELQSLEHLNLVETNITQIALGYLHYMQNLRTLRIPRSDILVSDLQLQLPFLPRIFPSYWIGEYYLESGVVIV